MNFHHIRLSDISLRCLIKSLARSFWMVIAAGLILFIGISLYFDWFFQPVYQANMTCAVVSGESASAAKEQASLLCNILMTDMIRDAIGEASPRLAGFDGSIAASVVSKSNFLVVTVLDSSPQEACLVLEAIAGLFPALTAYISSGSEIHIIQAPTVAGTPVNQVDVGLYQILAPLAGAAAMLLILCLRFLRRETIQTRSAARRLLNGPIIASIGREPRPRTGKPLRIFGKDTSFAYVQQIHTICIRLEQEAAARGSKLFMITSVDENEGKSTVAANVAAALAITGKKVAILDCSLRAPSIYQFFGKQASAPLPLNRMLAQPFRRKNLLQCMQCHDRLGLYMLCTRYPDPQGPELLSGRTMERLLLQLRVFDYVILDTPAMGYFAEAEALASQVDATMLVVRQDRTPAPDINHCIGILCASGSDFLGCILNDMAGGYGWGSEHKNKRRKKTAR